MNFSIEQRKTLTKLYPYLIPRNVWTGEYDPDYNYEYIRGEGEIPEGWRRLFFMYCKAIRLPLITDDFLNKFNFSDIKEKYGTLRLNNLGYPSSIEHLTTIYECFSQYICQECGQWASIQTYPWVESLCDTCNNKLNLNSRFDKLNKPKWATVEEWSKNSGFTKTNYSYKSLIKEYTRVKDMSDEEFYNYLIN